MTLRRIFVFLIATIVAFSLGAQQVPKTFNESPELTKQVKAKTLPDLKSRLPADVMVVKPVDKVGKYGGTLRTVDISGVEVGGIVKEGLFALAQDFGTGSHDWYKGHAEQKVVPNIAKDGKFSKDFKTFTMTLRKGMKWSDGQPVTTNDFMFWWTDIVNNKELSPDVPTVFRPGDKVMEVKKVDDFTIEFKFAVPYKFFTYYLCDLSVRMQPIRPAHYLKLFHKTYTKDVDKKAKDAGFTDWMALMTSKGGGVDNSETFWKNPDYPTLFAYKTTEYKPELWVGERNPYYFKVDTDGNQFPYIDKVVCELSSNTEVLMAKVVSGQVDYSAVALPFDQIPVLKFSEKNAGYTTYLWDTPMGAMPSILFNQSYGNDPELKKIFNDVRFRRAMSMAINRDEANKVAYFGLSYPTQATVLPGSRFLDPAYPKAWAEYSIEKANKLLDEMGLKWDSAKKVRLRSDGKPLTLVMETIDVGAIRGYSKILPLLKEYWAKVGVDVITKTIEPAQFGNRLFANELQITMWGVDTFDDYSIQILGPWIIPGTSYGGSTWHAPLWQDWAVSNGERGEEPPKEVLQMRDLWLKMRDSTNEAEITKLGKEIFKIQAEYIHVIAVVGSIKQPLILNNKIYNFPKDGVWANDTSLVTYAWAFQWSY